MLKNIILLCGFLLSSVCLQAGSVLIIDTAEREKRLYKPVFDIIENHGYAIDYRPLDVVLDSEVNDLTLLSPQYADAGSSGKQPKVVFFIFGTEFLAAPEKSHVCTKVLQALYCIAQRSGVLVGLIFPSMRAPANTNVVGACARIFNQFGMTTPAGAIPYPFAGSSERLDEKARDAMSTNAFFYMTNIFLSTPLESRTLDFHTTLSMPRLGIELDIFDMKIGLASKNCNLALLPSYAMCSPVIFKTLPYGVYWYNHHRKNHIFVTTNNILSFAGITENFHVTPMNSGLRMEMLQQVNRMMWEVLFLSQATSKAMVEKGLATIDSLPTPHPLPASSMAMNISAQQFDLKQKRKIAWMDIDVFAPCTADELKANPGKELERKQQRHDLIQNIKASGLDALWITANPQMYFSPIAKRNLPDQLVQYKAMLVNFASAIVDAYAASRENIPGIYIGFEITNNLYQPNLPARHSVDLYENMYTDLPVATDLDFWRHEVINPMQHFLTLWQNPAVSQGLPIAGVVLDLEMYCRKKTGSFTTIMGFDNHSFQGFVSQAKLPWHSVAKRDRALKLMEHKKMGRYYLYLENEAKMVGLFLKNAFKNMLPQGGIMCYMPHIQISWFYKGLVNGLTSPTQPVQLLTFNSEFLAHQEWFEQQKTPVTHACVLMLSKIRETSDFDLISDILMRHGAIWLNKFSRTVEPIMRDWTNIEQLPMPVADRGYFYQFLKEQ